MSRLDLGDPGAPIFFLSYARGRGERTNDYVSRFFEDLSMNLHELVPLPPGQDAGYLDRGVEGGTRWERELLHAVGSCQVFVPLLSNPYLHRSEWCAMEWDTFSRRRRLQRADGQPASGTGIVPILWAPVREVPEAVREVAVFTPDGLPDPAVTALYQAEGLYGLLAMGYRDAYQAITWKLARRVQQLLQAYFVEPDIPTSAAGLRRSFDTGPGKRPHKTAVPAPAPRRRYFYLSHAHVPPPLGGDDADGSMRRLYSDLVREVRQLARPGAGDEVGFYDGLLPAGADVRTAVGEELGVAEVFVPLYSPSYLARDWTLSERSAFRSRLGTAPDAARRIVPVLWTPVPEGHPEMAEALEMGDGVPGYADHGLQGLSRLPRFRKEYLAVLRRLARRIVELAEQSPLAPSPVVWPDRTGNRSGGADFVVAVVAPEEDPERSRSPAALASAVSVVAERLGMPARVVDFAEDRNVMLNHAGVLVIDPRFVNTEKGPALLAALAALPAWVAAVVIADRGIAAQVALVARVVEVLIGGGVERVRQVRDLAELVDLAPTVVTDARRAYLRNAPPTLGAPSARPRLAAGEGPAGVDQARS